MKLECFTIFQYKQYLIKNDLTFKQLFNPLILQFEKTLSYPLTINQNHPVCQISPCQVKPFSWAMMIERHKDFIW